MAKSAIRQRWDTTTDKAHLGRGSDSEDNRAWVEAVSRPIPAYRAKLVLLAHGQAEISVTATNEKSVINARMGFSPLLDCRRKDRTAEEQAKRDVENRNRAAKRARQNVRYKIKAVQADHMLTFSYRENVTDRAQVAAHWKEFVRLFRVRFPDWEYISVLEKQERGAIHIHVAVNGRQDIRWLLRCWLLAIGQPVGDVSAWLIQGVKLGEKSFGAVNVEAPTKRWGGVTRQWKADKLAGYLTKYIGKEFEEAEKSAKKYWASRNIEKPVITRFWLKAKNFTEAAIEAHDLIFYRGMSLSMWGNNMDNVIWICGDTPRERLGKITECVHDLDMLND